MKQTPPSVEIAWTPGKDTDGSKIVRGHAKTSRGLVLGASYAIKPHESETAILRRVCERAITLGVQKLERGETVAGISHATHAPVDPRQE